MSTPENLLDGAEPASEPETTTPPADQTPAPETATGKKDKKNKKTTSANPPAETGTTPPDETGTTPPDETGTTPPPGGAASGKEYSRTELYQLTLQETVNTTLNIKVSRKVAWELFKNIVSATVGDVLKNGRLPLQGVGTFEIKQAKPRKSKIETHNMVPRFRFRPGSKINEFLEKTMPGVFKG